MDEETNDEVNNENILNGIAPSSEQDNPIDVQTEKHQATDRVSLKDSDILGIYIHRTDHITFSIRQILVKVSVLNGVTGEKLLKEITDNPSTSYYENARNQKVTYIMPMMTSPFCVNSHQSLLPKWEELLQINENFEYITRKDHDVLFLFEVQDCFEVGMRTVAWSFLRMHDTLSGNINVNKRLRLQLYQPPSTKYSEVEWLKFVIRANHYSKEKIKSSLHVTISSLVPFNMRGRLGMSQRSIRPDQKEVGRREMVSCKQDAEKLDQVEFHKDWKRAPGSTSFFPNVLFTKSSVEGFGGFCCKFSPDGKYVAWTSASQFEHDITIERFLNYTDRSSFKVTAHSRLIYDLDWSADSKYLVACSGDQTATIWNIHDDIENKFPTLIVTLPAPCYLYSVKFNPILMNEVFLFGQNGHCYVFSFTKESFILQNDIQIVEEQINSAAISCNNANIFCVSKNGNLYFAPLQNGLLNAKFNCRKISTFGADCVSCHPKIPQKLAILCRNNSAYYLDINTGETHLLSGIVSNTQLSRCCFSPCGSLLLACCESGSVVCWNTVKKNRIGEILNVDLGYTAACRCVTYHPFYHAFASIAYQPKMGLSIWRYDQRLACAKVKPRPSIKPETKRSTIRVPLANNQKTQAFIDPLNSTNYTRVKSQFDMALQKMVALNRITSKANDKLEDADLRKGISRLPSLLKRVSLDQTGALHNKLLLPTSNANQNNPQLRKLSMEIDTENHGNFSSSNVSLQKTVSELTSQ